MPQPADAVRRAAILGKVLAYAFLAAVLGALIAFSVGSRVESPLGKTGAIILLAALAVMVVAAPIAIVLNIAAMRARARALREGVSQWTSSGSRMGDEK